MGLLQSIEEFKLSKKFKYFFFGMLCVLFPLVITIYGIIYFGGLWDPVSRLKNFKVSIVNDDVGCPETNIICRVLSQQVQIPTLGDMIKQNLLTNELTKDLFDWKNDFTNTTKNEERCYDIVEKYDRWGVIYIPENFTQNIISQIDKTPFTSPAALQMIKASLAQMFGGNVDSIDSFINVEDEIKKSEEATLFYIFDTARSYTSVTFLSTAFETIDKELKKNLALILYQNIKSTPISFPNKFYLNAYVSNYVDIHPLHKFGQNFSTFILFVVVYIAAISVNMVYRKYRPFHNFIQERKTNSSIIISAFSKVGINMIYMIITCALMILATFMFGGGQHEKNTFCAFLIYVLWAYIALSFCHVVSNLLPLLPFLGACVIFLVIQLATCGGIVANNLQPGFWNIGKALPMYYAVAELKFIYFNTGGRFSGRNVLVLLLWAVGLAVLDLVTCIFHLNNVKNQAPPANRDLEKQSMSSKSDSNRVTQKDIENNTEDITNMN